MTESTNLSASDIIRIILSDEKLKKKLIEALSDSLATKGDVIVILKEIKKLREDHNRDIKLVLSKLEEMQRDYIEERERIWDEIKQLREDSKRIQEEHAKERERIWDEIKQLREDSKRIQEEHAKEREHIWDEIKRLREEGEKQRERIWSAIRALQEETKALREDFNRFGLKLDALGARWGVLSEDAFRNALRGILEKRLNLKVSKWEDYDEEGIVYHEPSIIEIDVVIKNKEHTIIELKSHISKSDVATFLRKAEFYEKKTGIKPKLVMISPYIDTKAKEFAYKHKIKMYSSSYDPIEF
ncbi:MAG: DUF3782 domain-containing protein [Candidatus Odinarchaeota archaeon]|nr:DUF3782 domain-containing protein [Candidatus Odinarchaeota archaeon]